MKKGKITEGGEKAPRTPSLASKLTAKEPPPEKPRVKEPSEDGKSTQLSCIQITLWFEPKLPLKPELRHRKKQHVTK